jgi:hypothetical protein
LLCTPYPFLLSKSNKFIITEKCPVSRGTIHRIVIKEKDGLPFEGMELDKQKRVIIFLFAFARIPCGLPQG